MLDYSASLGADLPINGAAKAFVTPQDRLDFARDGAVCLRGLFEDWVETIAAGIEYNMTEPGPYAAENTTADDSGRFFDDYCNWPRIPEFRHLVEESPAAAVAAAIMGSRSAQVFHDHVLVKEPGTTKETPWHQDSPYYFVEGQQTVSMWVPVDPVREATLRFVAGSHLWKKLVLPVRWLDDSSFFPGQEDYLPVPDPDQAPEKFRVLEWEMEPGDAVLFHYRTLHGARANMTAQRRRAFSLRFVGDDAVYAERPGRTSPPYPGHNMCPGQRLREDWFPIVWQE
ncbi:MAG: phytanoyl-CoA dioxygenase family protein [Pseudomonadota bacterium]